MNMLSGANTPLESMPRWLATAMQASPSTHFVSFARLFFIAAWPHFLMVAAIGGLFFALAVRRFRATTAQQS